VVPDDWSPVELDPDEVEVLAVAPDEVATPGIV
jgi:hypothetical protein